MAAGRGIGADDLRSFTQGLFESAGMRAEHAHAIADILVWADLRGTESHGVERVPRYLDFIRLGHMATNAEPEVREMAGAAFIVEAHKAAGPIAMMAALDEAEKRARACGVAMGIINHTTHTGAIGYYAQIMASRGLAAIVMAAGMPLMAWPGTRAPSISTSPVSIGVPGGPNGATVLDMATAIAASGRLRKAIADKEPIPEGWALDDEGNPTTDPARATISLPIGGAKGAGLSLMIEILSGVLGAAPIVSEQAPVGVKRRHTSNGLIIAIDIEKFRPVSDFAGDVDLLAGVINGLPRTGPDADVRMPGERGEAEMRARMEKGIPLSARLRKTLADLGKERGVPVPPALAEHT